MNNGFEHEHLWYPLQKLGITSPYTAVYQETIINTWIALLLLIVFIGIARYFLFHASSQSSEESFNPQTPVITIYTYGTYLVKAIIKSFITLVEQSANTFTYRYFSFTASLFIFILACNWVGILPFVEEPTKDLNTTFALGIIALFYIQKEIIKVHGLTHYLKEYFLPVSTFFPLNIIIGLAMLPLKILGELASVVSLSFRLFGNIFGGAIIMNIFHTALAGSIIKNIVVMALGLNLILAGFFVLFEGGLQAFVFAILTLTNISMATTIEQGKH